MFFERSFSPHIKNRLRVRESLLSSLPSLWSFRGKSLHVFLNFDGILEFLDIFMEIFGVFMEFLDWKDWKIWCFWLCKEASYIGSQEAVCDIVTRSLRSATN